MLETEENEKINKGLARVYCLLFMLSLTTIITSIISSESRPHFEMRLRQQESLVICTNNMPSIGLDCRSESVTSGVQRIEDASIVKEYQLNVPRKTAVEGLEFIDKDEKLYIIMSTGSYGGFLNLLELNQNGEEWNVANTIKVDP